MRDNQEEYSEGEITGLQIPDDDLENWRELLIKEGFEQSFIEGFLANLNQRYSNKKLDEALNNPRAIERQISKASKFQELKKQKEAELDRKLSTAESMDLLEDVLKDKI